MADVLTGAELGLEFVVLLLDDLHGEVLLVLYGDNSFPIGLFRGVLSRGWRDFSGAFDGN
ncbi:hypothetical protein [Streptomyces sp. NPDC058671]|uniref:hypothetical protein n=1 Tax=Streptomyces sp. NPDC058671 TaxID=3346590 RepID=UPI00365A3289